MDLHPHCKPLAALLGTWTGAGHGEYPTIDSFDYLEEVTFGHVGKPFLAYSQKTRHAETGEPLHAETGYLRASEASAIEFVVVQPSGILESHAGQIVTTATGLELDLTLATVSTTATAKSVTDVVRRFRLADGVLSYTLAMAAVGEPLTHHLRAELTRPTD